MAKKMTRVQIPAYHDDWMKGDRYGELLGTFKVHWPHFPAKTVPREETVTRARVKLDKSGKTVTVNFEDCEVLS